MAKLDSLSLDEKVSLLSGDSFWTTQSLPDDDIASIVMSDGPNGLRKQGGQAGDNLGIGKSVPATCFPTAATLACSWDAALVEEIGTAIGQEARDQNINMVLGPGLNIIRDPLGGRNFEYFSEDPYVSGTLATAMVSGIQSQNVAACVKHYAVNSQETLRMTIDEIVDDRNLHEIHLEAFRRVVKYGQPQALMTSYNKINGSYANESNYLLQDVLRQQWGYDGLTVTDWVGTNDRVKSLAAGNDLEMPWSGGRTNRQIKRAVESGSLAVAKIDESVNRIVKLSRQLAKCTRIKQPSSLYDEHHKLSTRSAAESAVLLKNDGILPLSKFLSVAVIGDFANKPRYQGAGSSMVNPTKLDNGLDEIKREGYRVKNYSQGYKRFGGHNQRLLRQALANAKEADVAVVFLGLDESAESECIDRDNMKLNDNQLRLVNALARQQTKMVLILSGGAPVELPLADYPTVKAILQTHLGGQGSGEAVASLLSGRVNPSGKLATSYPLRYSDAPTSHIFPGQEATSDHRESIFVGYRYYESRQQPVRYPFGYGLSYTSFAYSKLKVSKNHVKINIKNTGPVQGSEIVQLYITPPSTHRAFRPLKELAAYAKVTLNPGETKTVELDIDNHSYGYYSPNKQSFVTLTGKYKILVGSSVQDIKDQSSILVSGSRLSSGELDSLKAYSKVGLKKTSRKDFEAVYGQKLPSSNWDKSKKLTLDDTLHQFKYSNFIGRSLLGSLMSIRKILFKFKKPVQANNMMFVINLPLKRYQLATGKKSSKLLARAVLFVVNI